MFDNLFYVILSTISTFYIIGTILNFFEITPDVYLIYLMYVIVIILFYVSLPTSMNKIFKNS
jgi:hypothetical protein